MSVIVAWMIIYLALGVVLALVMQNMVYGADEEGELDYSIRNVLNTLSPLTRFISYAVCIVIWPLVALILLKFTISAVINEIKKRRDD